MKKYHALSNSVNRRGQDNQSLSIFENYESTLCKVNEDSFENIALSLFRLQAEKNSIYNQYITHLGICPKDIKRLEHIPFLPISFFRSKAVISGCWKENTTFLSSSTTNSTPSRHKVKDISFYHTITTRIFNIFYGNLNKFHFLALLPSNSDRKNSSLATMMEHFIQKSESVHSGFYLYDRRSLYNTLDELRRSTKKVILWGVSFALMDLAEEQKIDLSHCIILETGGMKGKREELTRTDLHNFLCDRFNLKSIHSEYGMTELFSQAYSYGNGHFQTPAWMKVLIRNPKDPFELYGIGQSGGINVIDLANIHTCAFVETEDIGKINQSGDFEVLGRMDNADIRGCNLLI